jgi:hypothetical protein
MCALTSLPNKLFASTSLPAALSVALLYLAAVTGGDDGKWLFRVGITFAVLAFVCGRITLISHHLRILENRVSELAQADHELRQEIKQLKIDYDAREASIAAQQAFGRVAQRHGGRHLFPTRIEDADGVG